MARLTLTLGVRWDRQEPHYEASIRNAALSAIFPAQTVPATTLLTSNKIVPRLGFSYDLVGDGKSVVKGFYGRYYFNFADRLANLNPGGTNRRDYRFNDLNDNRIFDGVQELGTLIASAGGSSTTLDPNLKTPYTDELSVSYERQFWGESSFRGAYVRKMSRDEFATYNIMREGQFIVPVAASVTMRVFAQLLDYWGSRARQVFNVFDIPDAVRGQVRNVVANIPESVGGGDSTTTRCSSRSTSDSRAGCSSRAASTTSGATS